MHILKVDFPLRVGLIFKNHMRGQELSAQKKRFQNTSSLVNYWTVYDTMEL